MTSPRPSLGSSTPIRSNRFQPGRAITGPAPLDLDVETQQPGDAANPNAGGNFVRSLEAPKYGFDAYAEKYLGGAGGRKLTAKGNKGAVYMEGPFKGKTQGQAYEALRTAYAGMSPEARAPFESRANGRDVMSAGEVGAQQKNYNARALASGSPMPGAGQATAGAPTAQTPPTPPTAQTAGQVTASPTRSIIQMGTQPGQPSVSPPATSAPVSPGVPAPSVPGNGVTKSLTPDLTARGVPVDSAAGQALAATFTKQPEPFSKPNGVPVNSPAGQALASTFTKQPEPFSKPNGVPVNSPAGQALASTFTKQPEPFSKPSGVPVDSAAGKALASTFTKQPEPFSKPSGVPVDSPEGRSLAETFTRSIAPDPEEAKRKDLIAAGR